MQCVTVKEDKQQEIFHNLATQWQHVLLLMAYAGKHNKWFINVLCVERGCCKLNSDRTSYEHIPSHFFGCVIFSHRFHSATVSWLQRQEFVTSALVNSGSTLQFDSSDALVCSVFLNRRWSQLVSRCRVSVELHSLSFPGSSAVLF